MVGKTETRRLLVSYEAASGGPPTSGVARDLALGGLFIETKQPLPIGTLLTVEVPSSSTPLVLEARVISTRASREGPGRPAGMAVRFLDLPERVLMQLQYVFERHRPPERTRMGVGESEPPWSAPPPPAESDAAVADRAVEAAALAPAPLPTIEAAPAEPAPPPRHPTPRMVPAAPGSSEALAPQPPSSPNAPAPAPTPHVAPAPSAPPPSAAPPSSLGGLPSRFEAASLEAPRRRTPAVFVVVGLVALIVLGAIVAAVVSSMR
jgi:hypothetical protein